VQRREEVRAQVNFFCGEERGEYGNESEREGVEGVER
jgi:hypothetical protein